MTLEISDTPVNFIVDRRASSRNAEIVRATTTPADGAAQQSDDVRFEPELVKLHSRAITAAVVAVPLLSVAFGLITIFFGNPWSLLAWPAVTALCYVPLALISRKYDRTDMASIIAPAAARNLLAAHFLSGLGWIYFVMLDCATCGSEHGTLLKAMVLLLVIAATALITSSLRGAVLVTFTLPVLAFGAFAVRANAPMPLILFAFLVAGLVFLAYVSSTIHQSTQAMLAFRSEHDALVSELKTTKAISDEARGKAEDASLAKSRFLASMSHELRTPLNAILGFSEVMSHQVLGPMSNPSYLEYARDIHESGRHLLDLINEILDLSRIEAGRYQLNEEPTDLTALVDECCHMVELKARQKHITILRQLEADMPSLLADQRAVRQIVLNLLSNAIKFAPDGGEVRVRAGWTAGGGQYVSIKDNGPGIPEAEIPVVLSAFGQGSIATKSAEQGTGLGLPIVQSLLAIHGGEFQLRSKLHEGTEAVAIFPPARVMAARAATPVG